ncbi:MAG: pyridoxamine 5'-phosphate oxidase family protein [Vulcanimicrobiota bacterium]
MISHAEFSRTLLRGGEGALSTLADGFPYGSLVQYAADAHGNPLLFISDLAEHTQNLLIDPRASLMVWDQAGELDPLAVGRVTLVGRAVKASEGLETYLEAIPQARAYTGFKDFHLWRLEVERVRYVGGFGQMSWVAVEEYRQSEPDPVAKLAAGVISHMNEDHGDALLLLAGKKLGTPVEQARMVNCDGAGYLLKADGKLVRIDYASRCRTSEELRKEFVRQVQEIRGQ